MDATACNKASSGALRAAENNVTTFEQCVAFCASCTACNFVSFSLNHDDCSWYEACDLAHLEDHSIYTSVAVKNASTSLLSGVRVFRREQQLPSPRYANCVVDGVQAVTVDDNAAAAAPGVDAEWFAAQKEAALAEKCAVRDVGGAGAGAAAAAAAAAAGAAGAKKRKCIRTRRHRT